MNVTNRTTVMMELFNKFEEDICQFESKDLYGSIFAKRVVYLQNCVYDFAMALHTADK